ncbi:GDYXXLXY domain-containing protein [Nocardioides hwasunensis]|uniref:GDYXXLXY domain-containing protein n=1 Tax=Nocardioides hwasunensis TaxID=397258 RepID=A0ABR8MCS3_9ACTN|nr:GDYXXLXY domain-containing protein [Nocardioides hwasunensis]MBD3913931.1 GDYXXLXY domain-containing protein [Nocardioides hwasunensis]
MNRILTTAVIAVGQLAAVGLAVAPQLSARTTGETYLMRVAPVDPIDPFRGAYVALDYPGLHLDDETVPDDAGHGDLYVTLVQDGDLWRAGTRSRARPDSGPYLACDDRAWQVRCGIESWFLPQDEAARAEQQLQDGAVAEVRVDGRGHAAVVDVRAP